MKARILAAIALLLGATLTVFSLSSCSGIPDAPDPQDAATMPEKKVGGGHWVRDERNRPRYVW